MLKLYVSYTVQVTIGSIKLTPKKGVLYKSWVQSNQDHALYIPDKYPLNAYIYIYHNHLYSTLLAIAPIA